MDQGNPKEVQGKKVCEEQKQQLNSERRSVRTFSYTQ